MNDTAIVSEPVEVQLFTILKCNIHCSYCVQDVGGVYDSYGRADYTIDQLETFLNTHLTGNKYYFTFFGGEPLMNKKFIMKVMERFPDVPCQLQTNGTLLSRMPHWLIERCDNFLISLDGTEFFTDKYRGEGVYTAVMTSVNSIRSYAKGTLVARMTYADPDITSDDFMHLLNVAKFDMIHFQFAQLEGVYEPEHMIKKKKVIDDLVDIFFEYKDEILPIVPLMAVARNLAVPGSEDLNCKGHTHCRVSTSLLNIRPDGKIYGCPDMTWLEDMKHGDVKENWLKRSPLQYTPEMPCHTCEVFSWCKGNCMKNMWTAYVLKDDKYRTEVVEPCCELVKYLGKSMQRYDIKSWFNSLSEENKDFLLHAPIYDRVEMIP